MQINNNLMEEIYMFGKEKKEKRFMIKEQQSLGFGAVYIIVDTQTGVNYLTSVATGMNGMTPLLDSEGKVIVDR